MIININTRLKKIKDLGKKYPWQKPERCPRCGNCTLWGHGFVKRYFDGYSACLFLKRWRCPLCGAVHTMRPINYYPRFQLPIFIIFLSIFSKIVFSRWLKRDITRQRQQYWFKGFIKQAHRFKNPNNLFCLLWQMILNGVIISTHSLEYFETKPALFTPHPTFALTYFTGFV